MTQPDRAPPADAPVVIVLGMHRSGTSLCASLLHAAGIDMLGREQPLPTEGNRKGHFERWGLVAAHRRMLERFGQGYASLGALPPLWWKDPELAGLIGEIEAVVAANRGRGRWGLKDPRAMRLFRVWRELLDRLGLAYRLVLCLRRPWHVARSLNRRDGMSLEAGLALWLRYHTDFLTAHADLSWLVADYDAWFAAPAPLLDRLLAYCALDPAPDAAARQDLIARTVAPDLRHSSGPEAGPPALAALYEAIRATCQTHPQAPENRRRLALRLRLACRPGGP